MIWSKKGFIEPTAGVKEAKICPKLAKSALYSYLQWSNFKIVEIVNIFLCFSKTAYMATIISTINKVIKLSAGEGKGKFCPKLFKKPIQSYLKFQNCYICQQTLNFPNMTSYLGNTISGKNVVTELTIRLSETKENPKFAKKLLHFLIFWSHPSPKVSINLYIFQTKHIHRCNVFSNNIIIMLLSLFTFMFAFFIVSSCWRSLMQLDTIWTCITLLVATVNLEIIFTLIILI